MAHVVFYEKPGCANNARQKRLLEAAGHSLNVRSLLEEPWTAERLLSFFAGRHVAEWFNRAAPKVKSGVIDPESVDAERAIALMLAEPILIRRPLMEVEGARAVGFDPDYVDAWIGLSSPQAKGADLETCRRGSKAVSSDAVQSEDAP